MRRRARRALGHVDELEVTRVGYGERGPFIVLRSADGSGVQVTARRGGPSLVAYHLGILGIGAGEPAARVAVLAVHLDAALAAAQPSADVGVLLGALAPVRDRINALVDRCSGGVSAARPVVSRPGPGRPGA